MAYFENDPLLTEQLKAILREFFPDAEEAAVQDAFDAIDALLHSDEENADEHG